MEELPQDAAAGVDGAADGANGAEGDAGADDDADEPEDAGAGADADESENESADAGVTVRELAGEQKKDQQVVVDADMRHAWGASWTDSLVQQEMTLTASASGATCWAGAGRSSSWLSVGEAGQCNGKGRL